MTVARASLALGLVGAAVATAVLAALMADAAPAWLSAWLDPAAGVLLASGLAVQVWATSAGMQSFLLLGLVVNLVIACYAPMSWLASDPVGSVLRILAVAVLFGGAVALGLTYVIASRLPPNGR